MTRARATFGAHRLYGEAAYEHYLFIGSTGSGKTTFVKMLMHSVLSNQALPPRAFLYDPKREFLRALEGMGRLKDCVILNPMDARCSAWDLAQDIDDPISARELATILTPESAGGGDNRFFTNAVRDILTAVTLTLIDAPKNRKAWTFRDLILACLFPTYLKAMLSHTHDWKGRPLLSNIRVQDVYFNRADRRTRANIEASIQAALSVYGPIAAVWHDVTRRSDPSWRTTFSLREWIEDSGDILLLGNDEAARSSLDPINQAIFQRASELMLNQPSIERSTSVDRTWVILDEVREAGKLPVLSRLLNKARSHGITVVLSFQDIEGLKAEYGESVAYEIVAQCGNKAILKLDSPESAKWAVGVFGEQMGPEESVGYTRSSQPSTNVGFHRMVRANLVTSQVLFLAKAGVENGVPAFYKYSEQDPDSPLLFSETDWAKDIAPALPPETQVESFKPHSSADVFSLKKWGQDDWDRLGFVGAPPPIREEEE